MDDPGNDLYGERDPLDRLFSLLGPKLDELRALLEEGTRRWRGDAVRVGEGTRQRLNSFLRVPPGSPGIVLGQFERLGLRSRTRRTANGS